MDVQEETGLCVFLHSDGHWAGIKVIACSWGGGLE